MLWKHTVNSFVEEHSTQETIQKTININLNLNLSDLQSFPSYKTIIKITFLLSDLQKSDLGLNHIWLSGGSNLETLIHYIRNQISIIQESLYLYDKSIAVSEPFCRKIKEENYIKKDKARVDRVLTEKWKNYIKHIRDKTGFHYDDEIVSYSRRDIYKNDNPDFRITRGEGIQNWQFPEADKILTSYILDHAPKEYHINLSRRQIIKRIDFIRKCLVSYYSEFLWVYFESYEQYKR